MARRIPVREMLRLRASGLSATAMARTPSLAALATGASALRAALGALLVLVVGIVMLLHALSSFCRGAAAQRKAGGLPRITLTVGACAPMNLHVQASSLCRGTLGALLRTQAIGDQHADSHGSAVSRALARTFARVANPVRIPQLAHAPHKPHIRRQTRQESFDHGRILDTSSCDYPLPLRGRVCYTVTVMMAKEPGGGETPGASSRRALCRLHKGGHRWHTRNST